MASLTTRHMATTTLKEADKVLSACFDALRQGKVENREAGLISDCADDYTKLFRSRLQHEKSVGREPDSVAGTPELQCLMDFLVGADYPAAVTEANRIRTLMKPILENARASLREARR